MRRVADPVSAIFHSADAEPHQINSFVFYGAAPLSGFDEETMTTSLKLEYVRNNEGSAAKMDVSER